MEAGSVSTWREKAKKLRNVQSDELTKLPKAPFVSFGSESPDDIPDFFGPSAAANDPPPRCRAWRVTMTDGTRLIAVRPEGCARAEMLATVREQFGAGRVAGVESLERGTQHA
jgi:hypothetical protein